MATGSAGHSDNYLVFNRRTQESRPLNIDEKERLMGWEVGSTAEGLDDTGNTVSMQMKDRERLLGDRQVSVLLMYRYSPLTLTPVIARPHLFVAD